MKLKLFSILFLLTLTRSNLIAQFKHSVSVQSCLKPFYHGVASGDPLHDKVIIWTRVTPEPSQMFNSIAVSWRVATDTGMVNIVKSGALLTDSSSDYTVKVDVDGLNPNTFYFYEFQVDNQLSPRGRTKTNPIGNCDSLRFAITSCANFEAGWFNVYGSLFQRNDFDAVICLGDYIYEYNTGGYSPNSNVNRQWSPANEIVSLADYRMRYSSYRLDDDLQKLHQQFPFICVYDDHEFTNDAWMNGAQNHQPSEGLWSARKMVAQKAYFEWLPIRVTGTTNPYQIYRSMKYGNLIELMMLDTRVEGRDLQAGTTGATVNRMSRQLLGTTQFNWLSSKLSNSTSKWKVLGQQVMMAPLKVFGVAVNGDQWDGYPAERDRVLNHVITNNISNFVVITGDIHTAWANDLPLPTYNSSTGAGSAGVEFVCSSVTSPGSSLPIGASAIQAANSHIKYVDLTEHGYIIMDVNQNRTQADWFNVNTLDTKSTSFNHAKSFYVNNLQRFLISNNSAAIPRSNIQYIYAPQCPRALITNTSTSLQGIDSSPIVLSVYPNPSEEYLSVQMQNQIAGVVTISVFSIEGKMLISKSYKVDEGNLEKYHLDITQLANGPYLLKVSDGKYSKNFKFVKH
jgi:alkaline phosphatase D